MKESFTIGDTTIQIREVDFGLDVDNKNYPYADILVTDPEGRPHPRKHVRPPLTIGGVKAGRSVMDEETYLGVKDPKLAEKHVKFFVEDERIGLQSITDEE
jgi:hypothetical protein